MARGHTFSELCKKLGKDALYVKNLQQRLSLHIPEKKYSASYLQFMSKLIALRTFGITSEKILTLFETEKKILELLRIDSLSDSSTWYLDACRDQVKSVNTDNRLLLTGYKLDYPCESTAIQGNLDFKERDEELFDGVEMGEDVRKVLAKYQQLLKNIKAKLKKEKSGLQKSLEWANKILEN